MCTECIVLCTIRAIYSAHRAYNMHNMREIGRCTIFVHLIHVHIYTPNIHMCLTHNDTPQLNTPQYTPSNIQQMKEMQLINTLFSNKIYYKLYYFSILISYLFSSFIYFYCFFCSMTSCWGCIVVCLIGCVLNAQIVHMFNCSRTKNKLNTYRRKQ